MEKYIAQAKAHNDRISVRSRAKYRITPKDCYNIEQDHLALTRVIASSPYVIKLKNKWLKNLNIDPIVWNDINIKGLDKEEMILQAMGLTL